MARYLFLLLTGTTTVLAVVFATLWWQGELSAAETGLTLDRTRHALAALSHQQRLQQRTVLQTSAEATAAVTQLSREANALRRTLAEAQAAAATAEEARGVLAAGFSQQVNADKMVAANLDQERFRAAQLEQNLTLTKEEIARRAADHEQQVGTLQSNVVSLRDAVAQRESEVQSITVAATDEIARTRRDAQESRQEADRLACEVRTLTSEREQLFCSIRNLELSVNSSALLNQQLQQRIHELECRLREQPPRPPPVP